VASRVVPAHGPAFRADPDTPCRRWQWQFPQGSSHLDAPSGGGSPLRSPGRRGATVPPS